MKMKAERGKVYMVQHGEKERGRLHLQNTYIFVYQCPSVLRAAHEQEHFVDGRCTRIILNWKTLFFPHQLNTPNFII